MKQTDALLEKISVALFHWINNLLLSIIALLKVLIKSKIGIRLPKSDKSVCYVLGNGPSLKKSLETQMEKLCNPSNTVMVVNGFACSDEFITIRPEYYLFLDPYFSDYNGMDFHVTLIGDTYQHLIEKVNWKMSLLVPVRSRHNPFFKELIKRNSNISIVFYNYVVANGFDVIKFWLYKHQLAMPQCQNVLGACIMSAINMQFKEIVLLGADHSWHEQITITGTNEVEVLDKHFYNLKGLKLKQSSRVHNPHQYGIHRFFENCAKVFLGYRIIASYAHYCGVKVVNASSKSYIDAFERVK